MWLSQQQIAELFQVTRENITMHLRNVFDEGELDRSATSEDFLQVRQEGGLDEAATCRKSRQVRTEGSRQVTRQLPFYNLDLIISVGYRVKSKVATQFRIWATGRLRDYLVQGCTINEQRLEQLGSIVQILARYSDELVAGVADVLAEYLPGRTLLRDYDEGSIDTAPDSVPDLTHPHRGTVCHRAGGRRVSGRRVVRQGARKTSSSTSRARRRTRSPTRAAPPRAAARLREADAGINRLIRWHPSSRAARRPTQRTREVSPPEPSLRSCEITV